MRSLKFNNLKYLPKLSRKNIYSKKEDQEEIHQSYSKINEIFEKLKDDKFTEKIVLNNKTEIKNNEKPIRITYVDMKKKKNNSDKKSFMFTNESSIQKTKLDNEFPIKDFVKLKGYQNEKKIDIATYKYPARNGQPKGVVYLIHNILENANTYASIASNLSNENYDVISLDLRGHGRSDGIKDFLDSKEAIIEDILNLILLTEKNYQNLDKFIMGYSVGACISSLVSSIKDLNGVILISPTFQINYKKDKKKMIFFNLIGKIFSHFPIIKINGLDTKLKLKTFNTINDLAVSSFTNSININTPLYILHGKEDKFGLCDGSLKFYEKTPINDKVLILREDLGQDIVKDLSWNVIINDIIFWMKIHSN